MVISILQMELWIVKRAEVPMALVRGREAPQVSLRLWLASGCKAVETAEEVTRNLKLSQKSPGTGGLQKLMLKHKVNPR